LNKKESVMSTESEGQKDKKENENKQKEKDVVLKESAYSLCPIH